MSKLRNKLKKRTEDSVQHKDKGNFGKGIFIPSKIEDIEFYKLDPKKKKGLFDVIPYNITTNNHPFEKKGEVDYFLDVWIHKNVGASNDTFICLKNTYSKHCPICEEREKLRNAGEKEDMWKPLYPTRRSVYNIIDLIEGDDKIRIFDAPYNWFEKELIDIMEAEDDGEVIVHADPEEGYSIKFRISEKSFNGRAYGEPKNLSFEEREEAYDESIIEEAHSLDSLIHVPTYEEVSAAFFGHDSEESETEEEEEAEEEQEEKPLRKKKKKKAPVEELEDETAFPEEGEKPKKKKKHSKEKENPCPANHKFGVDTDEKEECGECGQYDECLDKFNEED